MKDFDFKNFWNDSAESKRDWILPMPTDDELLEIEKKLGYKLPQAYIELMKNSHNGGLLKRNAYVKLNKENEITELCRIDYIDSINKLKSESERKAFPGLASLPDVGIYFGSHIEGREKFALDYSAADSSEPHISVILYSVKDKKYYPKRIADNFQEFIESLRKLEKPASFDFAVLKEKIKASSIQALTQVQQIKTEKIIAFGLFTGNDAKFIAPAINTAGHLAAHIAEFPGEKDFYTYSTTEWKYEGNLMSDSFDEINLIIDKYHIYLKSDKQITGFRKLILDTCVTSLIELKRENAFPSDITLMVNVSNAALPKSQFKKIIAELN